MLELCTGIHVTKKRIYCLWSLSAYLSILTGLFGLNCLVWQATVIKLTKWFPVSTKHTYKFQWLTNFLKIYLFFAALGLHCCTKAFSSCSQRGYSWVLVASLVAEQTPGAQASVIAARGPSRCSPRAQLFRGIWDLPGPGINPESSALTGRHPTTGPPGKP